MKKTPSLIDAVNKNMIWIKDIGIGHVEIDTKKIEDTTINLKGKETNFFGSCSYLNFEIDERLKTAAIEAINIFGVHFSSSRAYVSLPLHSELESLLTKVFGGPTVVALSTTLGHLANLPIIIGKNDAIILDQQVHNSIQMATRIVAASGTHLGVVRHNNMDQLDQKVESLKGSHDKIWYMADGIYSMYGDACPIAELFVLMEKHEQLHLYVDDAHGMSWTGENGKGYILDLVGIHPRVVFTTSLGKGFGSSGGATVFPNKEMADLVRNCGSTHLFSGPLQPPILAAAIASAKIHLSPEIYEHQDKLKKNIRYFQELVKQFNLPLVSSSPTPIKYIGAGTPEMATKLCKGLLDRGYYTGVAGYPSVPVNNSGIRMTINRLHTKKQIHGLVSTISELMDEILIEHDYSKEEILGAFKRRVKKESA
ncbi:MAG: 7-keto-8-aminopelargonate synthetase-like enzyme [Polaribacter sp.]|jgi:7-keto-8-aminopelargonate synthetase-like enzyme